ncbi:MAG: hypothetical protein HYX68_01430 [Planctomycetes bacterium]|nr:hypothetical protein [Planctomycetota bacterium]
MSSDVKAEQGARINITPSWEKAIQTYERELATYVRKLPQLIEDGAEGRYALIKGEDILSLWDTQRDAIQAGRERFGLAPICVVKVEGRKLERFALLLEQIKERSCQG